MLHTYCFYFHILHRRHRRLRFPFRFSFGAAILVWAFCYTFQIFIVKRDWINVCLRLVLPTLCHSRHTVLHSWYGKPMWLYNIIRTIVPSFIRKSELFGLPPYPRIIDLLYPKYTYWKNAFVPRKYLWNYMVFVSSHSFGDSNTNFELLRTMMHNKSDFYIFIHYSAATLWLFTRLCRLHMPRSPFKFQVADFCLEKDCFSYNLGNSLFRSWLNFQQLHFVNSRALISKYKIFILSLLAVAKKLMADINTRVK